ncbi:MAG: hypothetical protein LWX01_13400, partial [Deltaproteobacteria bacterium]|nr:hypothetical protein [Deltaproteobacteria bacterium]
FVPLGLILPDQPNRAVRTRTLRGVGGGSCEAPPYPDNARLGYEKEGFEIYLWAKNLFDEEYVTRAFEIAELGGYFGRAGDPQTFGITLTARF